jgi:U3 small nucleolar RNA-associated protein 18
MPGHKRTRAEERDRLIASKRDAEDDRLEALVFSTAVAARDAQAKATKAGTSPAKRAPLPSAAPPAWHDDDDDAIGVDIAAVSRSRKLRETEGETVVSGTDYVRRLRAFHAKHSLSRGEVPSWAVPRAERRVDRSDDEEGDVGGRTAAAEGDDDDAADGELLASAGGLLQAPAALLPGRLSVTRVRDANRAEPSQAVLQSIAWHHEGGVVATAGLDKTLRFFAVDGKRNAKVASVHFPDLPIASAGWTADGSEVVVTGRRSFFYAYNVDAGAAHRIARIPGIDDRSLESALVSPPWLSGGASGSADGGLIAVLCAGGYVALLSARTKQRVGGVKVGAGSVRAAAWSVAPGTGNAAAPELLTIGDAGEVFRWDLRTMSCAGRYADEGSTGGTALAASRDGSRWAVGARSGVVNVYDAEALTSGGGSSTSARQSYSSASAAAGASASVRALFSGAAGAPTKPLWTCMSLTTGVDTLDFSHDGALLALASRRITDSLRVMHVGTGTVFSNWPTARTPLHFVSTAAFSPHSGYLSVGNDRGRALLYRVNHYSQA